ncbi:TPA: hypothetical protein ACN37W_004104 [Vibrio parahaemolyticus]
MINLFKNRLICNCGLILFLFASNTFATTITGRIKGGDLFFLNGINLSGDQMTTSNWQPLETLQPTIEWAPGTFMGSPSGNVTLTNTESEGESVSVDIDVVGLQYNLGDSAAHFHETTVSSGHKCLTSEYDGAVVTVVGDFCIGNAMSSDTMFTPFHFLRPIIELDKTAIVDAFRAAKVSSGQFVGTTMVRPFYAFKSPTGSLTYRNGIAIPIHFSFFYEASSLESLWVTGDGVMQPKYDSVLHTVSGGTKYRVIAKGMFSSGLKLTFSSSDEDGYQLSYVDDESLLPIPYSIFCRQCENQNVVVDGELQVVDGETVASMIDTSSSDSIDLNFDVSFHDIAASDVETGAYRGSFVVLFEENLE